MDEDITAVQPLLLPIGYRLEEFEILRVLGEGGFGTVYLARDHRLNQLRAIKEYEPDEVSVRAPGYSVQPKNTQQCVDTYREGLKSFINEAQLLASIDHPNIVRVYRCIEANNTAYIVMHYCEGETLETWITRQGGRKPDPYWTQHLLWQLLDGLQVIHAKGILHRDIKPSNIYLIDGYRPVLIDFGAARRVATGTDKSLTSIVTVGFSPIEQYGDGDSSDQTIRQGPWTDIYALGATLYKLITGNKPPDPHLLIVNGRTLSTAKTTTTFYPPIFLRSIDKALSVKPADRFQSAAEWRDALGVDDFMGIPKSPLAAIRKVLSSAWLRWAGGIALLVAAGSGGYFWNHWQQTIVSDVPQDDEVSSPVQVDPEPEPAKQPITEPQLPKQESTPSTEITPVAKPVTRYVAGQSFQDCEDCPELVVIPPGEFTMGSPLSVPGRQPDEGPLHHVSIPAPFALGKYEVTREHWRRFVKASAYETKGCDDWRDGGWKRNASLNWEHPGFSQHERDPVLCVTWEDASNYVKWLSAETGESYRLPSEAEWEYAARAGTIDANYWADDAKDICTYANANDKACNDRQTNTSQVGGFLPNAFGLYDMLGNVWEWTEDCWHASYEDAPNNGSAWLEGGDCGLRVLRGGSWMDAASITRFANRDKESANTGAAIHGFRVARDLPPSTND